MLFPGNSTICLYPLEMFQSSRKVIHSLLVNRCASMFQIPSGDLHAAGNLEWTSRPREMNGPPTLQGGVFVGSRGFAEFSGTELKWQLQA